MIYDQLWHGKWVADCGEDDCSFMLAYGFSERQVPNDDGIVWLLTCTQFFHEAMEQFYRKARCVDFATRRCITRSFKPRSVAFRCFALLRIRHIDLIDPELLEFDFILHRSLCENFGLRDDAEFYIRRHVEKHFEWQGLPEGDLRHWVQLGRYGDPSAFGLIIPRYRAYRYFWLQQTEIEALVTRLGLRDHSMKTLKLQFSRPDVCNSYGMKEVESVKRWHVDMSFLEQMGHGFERIEFTLQETWGVERPWDHLVFVQTQKEMARVAKSLVGAEQGYHWSLEDWILFDKSVRDEYARWHLVVQRLSSGPSRGQIDYLGRGEFRQEEDTSTMTSCSNDAPSRF